MGQGRVLAASSAGGHRIKRGASVSIEDVVEAVSQVFGISVERLLGRGRAADLCAARLIAYALARELTGKSLPQIGRHFHRDHTSVLSGIARVEDVHAAAHRDRIERARVLAKARAVPMFLRSGGHAQFVHRPADGGAA